MSSSIEQRLCHERMQVLDRLIDEFERQADPAACERFGEVVRTVLEIHAAGLGRTMDLIAGSKCGPELLDALASDPTVASMLLVHDLHPHDMETRVRTALEHARTFLASQGGEVEFIGIGAEGIVQLQLRGHFHGCAGSRSTLQSLIEQEIYAAGPDVSGVVVAGLADDTPQTGGFVPLERLRIRHNAAAAPASSTQ